MVETKSILKGSSEKEEVNMLEEAELQNVRNRENLYNSWTNSLLQNIREVKLLAEKHTASFSQRYWKI